LRVEGLGLGIGICLGVRLECAVPKGILKVSVRTEIIICIGDYSLPN